MPLAGACIACGTTFEAAQALRPGALFFSRYEILGMLGRGGMGIVYKARDRNVRELIALKILRPDLATQSKDAVRRFRSEIRLARQVRHANVCSIHGDGEHRGLLFIAMELVEGVDLAALIRRGDRPAPADAYDVCLQIAEGLAAIHDAGIIHRDLKPANIMVDRRGLIRVMDFGVAKQQSALTGGITATASGGLVGTTEYMSPEQIRTGMPIDHRADLYSLGIVLFELFTGRVPFRGETPAQTLLMHLQEPPPLDGAASASLPAALRPVIGKLLAKAPQDRFVSARETAQALRDVRDGSSQNSTTPKALPTVAVASLRETQSELPTLTAIQPGPVRSRFQGKRAFALWSPAFLAATAALISVYSLRPDPAGPAAATSATKTLRSLESGPSSVSASEPASVPRPTSSNWARLALAVEHNVTRGTLRVVVDRQERLSKPLTAGAVRKALIFKSRKGQLFETIDVAPGQHVIRIEVQDGHEKKLGEITGTFGAGQTRPLEVHVGSRLELAWR